MPYSAIVPLAGTLFAAAWYVILSWTSYPDLVVGYELPTLVAAIGMIGGVLYLCLLSVIRSTDRFQAFLMAGLVVGLIARLALFASDPILENDYIRYLWDGGVLALGENPYRWSPADVLSGMVPQQIQSLADQAGGLVGQIGYADLRTIYPPIATAFFAVAHFVDPWGGLGLRCVYLVADCATLVLLLSLLRQMDRSPLWILIYWLNPLAIQMIYNALHMDVLLLPFLAGALLFAMRRQPFATSLFLVFAAGVKLWPALLAPVLLRYASAHWRRFVTAGAVFAIGLMLVFLPFVVSGPADTSGLFAFSGEWRKNEVVFGIIVSGVNAVLGTIDTLRVDAEKVARMVIAVGLIVLSLWPVRTLDDRGLATRLLLLSAGLFVFAPAPYPWYFIWLLPFLVLLPSPAVLAWTATLPLYHLRFHSYFIENPDLFENGIVWVEHGLPLVLLAGTVLFRIVRR